METLLVLDLDFGVPWIYCSPAGLGTASAGGGHNTVGRSSAKGWLQGRMRSGAGKKLGSIASGPHHRHIYLLCPKMVLMR